jgi:High potential iron-sulfur protein
LLNVNLIGKATCQTILTGQFDPIKDSFMDKTSRRAFVMTMVAGGGALVASRVSAQAGGPVLSEADPQAVALGYKADNTKVDKTKYPQHADGQMCSGCNFFQGKPTDAMAPCQLFSGKQVSSKGWCSAYAKKA